MPDKENTSNNNSSKNKDDNPKTNKGYSPDENITPQPPQKDSSNDD